MTKDFYQQYIEELLGKINMVEENGKVDEDYAKQLSEELKKRVGLMIMDALPKDKFESYMKLIDGNASPEQVLEYLTANIDKFEELRMKTIEDFAVNFIDRAAKMREALK